MARMKSIVMTGPAQGLLLGVLVFAVAYWLGHVGLGLSLLLFAVMLVYSVILMVFRRSATVEVISQPSRDERTSNINMQASAVSLTVVCVLVVGAFLVDLAHGNTSTTP